MSKLCPCSLVRSAVLGPRVPGYCLYNTLCTQEKESFTKAVTSPPSWVCTNSGARDPGPLEGLHEEQGCNNFLICAYVHHENFNTSFTSTSPSLLLQVIQTSSLLLNAIFQNDFINTNLGNYNIRCYYIINSNGLMNCKQYRQTAP